jgi:adenylate cyclase
MAEIRKIAAILAADVVGFSRMTGADEDGTLARLRALRRDLIDPTVALHNGRVFKRTGDGALIEFRSVVDAVRCAIAVQNSMVERFSGVPPDRRIVFRIGIHLGDVVEESDGDLMGDGVNIAARLEGIAKPGAICLSEQAYWQVRSRLDLAVTDLGPTHLKNIAEPVRAFRCGVAAPPKPTSARQNPPASRSPTSLRSRCCRWNPWNPCELHHDRDSPLAFRLRVALGSVTPGTIPVSTTFNIADAMKRRPRSALQET